MNEPKQNKEIPHELELLEKAIYSLEEEIATVEKVFSPVVSQAPQVAQEETAKIVASTTCEVAERIRVCSNKALALRKVLSSISVRSQV